MSAGADDKRINAVLERIAKIHEPYSRYKHPLWAGLMEGRFEKPQVKEFIRQAGNIPLFNHLYHGPLYVKCPDPQWREMAFVDRSTMFPPYRCASCS